MKTIRVKHAKADFAYFVQRNQCGIIAEHLTYRKVHFLGGVFVAVAFLAS